MPAQQLAKRREIIRQKAEEVINDEIRPEDDFSEGILGKNFEAFIQASNVVVTDSDIADFLRYPVSVMKPYVR